MITSEERSYIRNLAKKLKEITLHEKWKQLEQDWKDVNGLNGRRTMLYTYVIDDIWMEILHPSKTLKIKDPLFRSIEYNILKRLYRAEHFCCDAVVYPDIYVPIEYRFSDWVEGRQKPFADMKEGQMRAVAAYHPVLETPSDIKKLRKPKLQYLDWKKTDENYEMVCDVLGDILPVHKGLPFGPHSDADVFGWGLSIIDVLAELRGLEELFYDFYEEPEFLHEVMAFMQEGYMDYIDTMEKENLFRLNNDAYISFNLVTGGENSGIGENGIGLTDELPQKDFDPNHVRAKDLWGYAMQQELTSVGPDMRYEFCMKYQKPIADRFGMWSYGCCENNDLCYGHIKNTFSNNLRVVSVPYSSDIQIAADNLKDYVMAWRPISLPINTYDEESFRKEVKKNMEIMKDNNSVYMIGAPLVLNGRPDIFDKMIRIIKEYSDAYARR